MPKAPTSSTTARSSGAPFPSAQVLRRNQACHQCRRRKLKCDAKRPCSTCLRSHAYSIAHAPSGTDFPPHPECTFDEISELSLPEFQDSPKNRFERLENKINELEAILREKEQSSPSDDSIPGRARPLASTDYAETSMLTSYPDMMSLDLSSGSIDMANFSVNQGLDDLTAAFMGIPLSFDDISQSHLPQYQERACSGPSDHNEAISLQWPKGLPMYPVLRQLVEAFFTHTPFAKRMFHSSTFLASLALPPTHSNFPFPAILHAMCALGSMYTYTEAVTRSSHTELLSKSFAESQIQAAKMGLESYSLCSTSNLFAALQAQVLIALWHWYNARWSEACIAFCVSLRLAVPCGLNVCAPYDGISSSNMRLSIIPPATDSLEEEVRRNTFWIAYMMERYFAAINNFAMFLDDEDVCQMLPIHADRLEHGISISPDDRQWSDNPDIMVQHLDGIDSFGLLVKASILLSKVKVFNGRYKRRQDRGDSALIPNPAGLPGMPIANLIQSTDAFVQIDRLIKCYLESFPLHLKDPVSNGTVDVALLTAISSAHFATIILHEGHAHIGVPSCISSCAILAASRSILNLLCQAHSTSYNLAWAGVFPMVCWFAAGRVLIRFLRAAIQAKSSEHIAALQTEVDFIRSVIASIGESVPHAKHYSRMLSDYLMHTCGKEYGKPVESPLCSSPGDGQSHQSEGKSFWQPETDKGQDSVDSSRSTTHDA